MFNAVVKIVKQLDNENKLEQQLKELKKLSVLVGIPQEKASRPELGEKVNNAELAYIHTNGSPIRNIPPRPIIEPAIKDSKEQIGDQLAKAAKATLDGKDGKPYLEKAGIIGQNASRGWFTNPKNGWQPNSPLTISKKGSDKPLIDTGELRKSITYVVRKKGK